MWRRGQGLRQLIATACFFVNPQRPQPTPCSPSPHLGQDACAQFPLGLELCPDRNSISSMWIWNSPMEGVGMNKSQKLGLEGGAGGRASVGATASLVSAPAAAWRWWWCVLGGGHVGSEQGIV